MNYNSKGVYYLCTLSLLKKETRGHLNDLSLSFQGVCMLELLHLDRSIVLYMNAARKAVERL